MTTEHLMDDVRRDEDCKLTAYPDPESPRAETGHGSGEPWTIGVGHTGPEVHEGLVWTQAQCDEALFKDLAHAEARLDDNIPWWRSLDPVRQDVLVNMCFNLGWGHLSAFHDTLAAIERGDYAAAADHMLASLWARQVKGRAIRLAEQMRSGVRLPRPL